MWDNQVFMLEREEGDAKQAVSEAGDVLTWTRQQQDGR